MAKETESGEEKTEDPSGRRLSESRREGDVCKSQELSLVASMTTAFLALQFIGPYLWTDLKILTSSAFTSRYGYQEPITINAIHSNSMSLFLLLGPEILAIMGITALVGSLVTAWQTKFLFTLKPLRPRFRNLNPIKGITRLFKAQNWINVGKAIAKLGIICPIAYYAFFDLLPEFLRLMDVPITDLLPYTAFAANYVFWKMMSLLMIVAILDYAYHYWQWRQNMKMSKTEKKEEAKATEGDMKTKYRIKAIGMQRLRQMMLKAVATADVVVTNPTHIAVALKYDLATNGAPKVVAKGKSHLAERIKRIAKEKGIPVIERKPLARALFRAVEVGQEIPYELYKAVAELLAYVYKIKGRNPLHRR